MDTREMQYATLEAIAPDVARVIDEHEVRRGSLESLWMPSDYAHTFRSGVEIPDVALVALVFNALTEDGLPSFHRLIATHLGEATVWARWNGIWTAEESRHGRVLGVYLEASRVVRMRQYDELLFTYHEKGFYPDWELNPYQLIAYTVLQERATQISHANVGGLVRKHNPVLAELLGKIAREEGRHCHVYSEVFRLILNREVSQTLVALSKVIRSFAMPGAVIPGFKDYAYLAERSGVFTAQHFKTIVEGVIKRFGLSELVIDDPIGKRAQEDILRYPKILARQTKRLQTQETQTLNFSFLPEADIVV